MSKNRAIELVFKHRKSTSFSFLWSVCINALWITTVYEMCCINRLALPCLMCEEKPIDYCSVISQRQVRERHQRNECKRMEKRQRLKGHGEKRERKERWCKDELNSCSPELCCFVPEGTLMFKTCLAIKDTHTHTHTHTHLKCAIGGLGKNGKRSVWSSSERWVYIG